MVEERDVAAWQARAALCELLALTFRYPTDELVAAVRTDEWIDAAREIAQAAGLDLDESAWEETCLLESGEDVLRALRIEATYLFIGTPDVRVSPYEGAWRAKAENRDFFAFVDPHTMEVERFARDCGLGQPEGKNEPLDHVATELELLQYLSLAAAGSVALEDDQESQMPGGSASEAYARFVEEHAAVWMEDFADAVIAASRIPLYRMAAETLKSFVRKGF